MLSNTLKRKGLLGKQGNPTNTFSLSPIHQLSMGYLFLPPGENPAEYIGMISLE